MPQALLFSTYEILPNGTDKIKEQVNALTMEKEVKKVSLFADNMIIYPENS